MRAKYEARRKDIGIEKLHAELAEIDPAAASIIEDKAKAVYDMCYGNVSPQCPASILQLHTNCTVIADEAALSLCPAK